MSRAEAPLAMKAALLALFRPDGPSSGEEECGQAVVQRPIPRLAQKVGAALVAVLLAVWLGAASAAQEQPALLDLMLNEQDHGEVLVYLRGSEVLARVTDLDDAGLKSFSGTRETIRGEQYVVLSSLRPLLDYKLDEVNLTLSLTARPELLGKAEVNLGSMKPSGIFYSSDPSAFFNYGLNLRQFAGFDGFFEAGLSLGRYLLYSAAFRSDQGLVVRGLTNLSLDEPEELRTLAFGDQLANSSDPLGGATFLGGVGYSRNFGLDPYFVRFPTQSISGALTTPSTVDVYVNGHLVRQELLPPGAFQLSNVPLTSGSGLTQVVIKDAFGNQREINSPYYLAPQVLGQGLSDFSYDLGFRRSNLGAASFDYGEPVLLARHRYGLTETITSGLRLEAARNLASGGPVLDLRLPYGAVEVSGGASYGEGSAGSAFSLAYSYMSDFSFGAAVQARTERYANLSLTPSGDRALAQVSLFCGFAIGPRVSVYPQYTYYDYRDRGREDELAVSINLRLAERFSAFLSTGFAGLAGRETVATGLISLNYFFGHATTASLGSGYSQRGSVASLDVEKALPYGPGYGYRVQAQTGATGDQLNGALQYQNNHGLYEVDYGRVGGQDITALSASGGIAAIGSRVFATRPVQQGFALLRVPGVDNVRGYLSNQDIGRTDSSGDLLVPNLLPYYGNLVGIEDGDLALDYAVEATQKTVAPTNRGGAIVTFPVHRLRAFTGKIEIVSSGKRSAAALGELTVTAEGKDFISPLGKAGEFYLESAPSGSHRARVEFEGGACTFIIDLPNSTNPIVPLGTLRCMMSGRPS